MGLLNHNRQFVRPLMIRATDHTSALLHVLAVRAEHDAALGEHLLAALAEVETAFDLDVEDTPRPVVVTQN